jgi:hypothetical protein
MSATLEERVETLEQELAALKSAGRSGLTPPVKKDWRSTFGWARNSPEFDRAMDAGEAYRRTQTCDTEVGERNAGT